MVSACQRCHSKSPKSETKVLTDFTFSLVFSVILCLSSVSARASMLSLWIQISLFFFTPISHVMHLGWGAHRTGSFGGQKTYRWSLDSLWWITRTHAVRLGGTYLYSLSHLASLFSLWDRIFLCSLSWLWTLDSLTSASECWSMPSRFPLWKVPIMWDQRLTFWFHFCSLTPLEVLFIFYYSHALK